MDSVKVTQADRDAYCRLAEIENSNIPFFASTMGKHIRDGGFDNSPQVQAFARHRLSAPSQEVVEVLRDAHNSILFCSGSCDHDLVPRIDALLTKLGAA